MRRMTRRQAVGTIIRSAGGLVVVRYLPGCATQEGGGTANNGNGTEEPDSTLLSIESIDHVKGDPEAPNIIIEYGDFECSTCGSFFREHEPAVLSELVEPGLAAFVFRHFPQPSIHPNSRGAAIAAECALDFFEYHDLLFNSQNDQDEEDEEDDGSALERDALIGYAEEVGLNATTFENCLESGAKVPRVDRDVDSGTRLGVVETPTFFVNGRMLAGDHTLEDFQALLVQ